MLLSTRRVTRAPMIWGWTRIRQSFRALEAAASYLLLCYRRKMLQSISWSIKRPGHIQLPTTEPSQPCQKLTCQLHHHMQNTQENHHDLKIHVYQDSRSQILMAVLQQNHNQHRGNHRHKPGCNRTLNGHWTIVLLLSMTSMEDQEGQ